MYQDNFYALACSVSGTTITFGTNVYLNGNASEGNFRLSVVPVSASTGIVVSSESSSNGSGAQARKCDVSGTTVTVQEGYPKIKVGGGTVRRCQAVDENNFILHLGDNFYLVDVETLVPYGPFSPAGFSNNHYNAWNYLGNDLMVVAYFTNDESSTSRLFTDIGVIDTVSKTIQFRGRTVGEPSVSSYINLRMATGVTGSETTFICYDTGTSTHTVYGHTVVFGESLAA